MVERLAVKATKGPWKTGNRDSCRRALAPRQFENKKSAWSYKQGQPFDPGSWVGEACDPAASRELQAVALYIFERFALLGRPAVARSSIEGIGITRTVIDGSVENDPQEHVVKLFDETHRSLATASESERADVVDAILAQQAFEIWRYTMLEIGEFIRHLLKHNLVREKYVQVAKEVADISVAS